MQKVLAPLALCAAFLLPGVSVAQETPGAGSAAGDRPAVTFDEVERGVYFAVYGGPSWIANPPASQGPRPFSSGQMAQVELGIDLGERLSLGVFFMGSANRAGSDYIGYSQGAASGDFTMLVPGAVLRAKLVGFADSQEVKRTWIYARAGAGYAMFSPKKLLPDSDILVFAGPGVEYYTRLRHFSVGLEVTGNYLASKGAFGFAVAPNIRYAF
ncbi:adventurous gliding motility protein CglE [Corallococcus sp. bb12-1]|uniref:adventurous gliding motility protein CglE n=1 Tax=Corallococcus sp. bb12-1 TaxID=2996784 RepID=UPI00226D93C3|nr:adventurous gliding motility protein CglE [Corallococcus sp. bb12-1]MCY1041459.1 adventurous gliding motility protein CglE [Corallococcus sp. bb12-1]